MKNAVPMLQVSIDNYLLGERSSQVWHEYVSGTIFEMVGAAHRHACENGKGFKQWLRGLSKRKRGLTPSKTRVVFIGHKPWTFPQTDFLASALRLTVIC